MDNSINYLGVLLSAIFAMFLGALWYGPIFGKLWMSLTGITKQDQKNSGSVMFFQFVVTLFEMLVLAHLIADTQTVPGVHRAVWIWAGFVVPSLFAAIMWASGSVEAKLKRLLLQSGYQLIIFTVAGFIFQSWI